MLGAAQALDAFDRDASRAGALDLRAHGVEQAREVLDLGLARAVLEHGRAARERRRHHQVLGAGDGRHREAEARAAQARRRAAST